MKKTKLILLGVLAVTGCSTSHTATAPTTTFDSNSSRSVTAEPFVVAQQTGLAAACPATPPLTATVNVIVFSGDASLIVTSIDARFVDQFGIQLPPVTLPAPVPTTQFGSALVEARSTQTFPVSVHFGCGTASRGTAFVDVGTRDAMGRQAMNHLSVDVR
jgi:hypothetical protein